MGTPLVCIQDVSSMSDNWASDAASQDIHHVSTQINTEHKGPAGQHPESQSMVVASCSQTERTASFIDLSSDEDSPHTVKGVEEFG